MKKWNYESRVKSSSGYEEVLTELKKFKKEEYISANEHEKEVIKDKVLKIYRNKNIFPITYFNEEGIKEEILKCCNKDINSNWSILDMKYTQGSALLKFLFPNIADIIFGNDKRTMLYKFYDDTNLKRAIHFCLTYKKSVSPSEIRGGLEMIGGGVYGDFSAMKAKAVYERYAPKDGIIFDYACGFGGRMLGALTSKNNYTYLGVEPNTETYNSLLILGEHIENATDTKKRFHIKQIGSEEKFTNKKEFVDFAFSSPPYFNLEKYSEEETQCYNKFSNLESWIEGYVRPTIFNIFNILKKNRYYAVNIADFKVGNKQFNFVDKWVEISEEIGFKLHENIDMKINLRSNAGYREQWKDKEKKEGIFVFYKA